MTSSLLSLPEDDNALIFRCDVHLYGGPAAATLAKYASRPQEAPIDLPYTFVGRRAAYSVGALRQLREAMTHANSAERKAKRANQIFERGG